MNGKKLMMEKLPHIKINKNSKNKLDLVINLNIQMKKEVLLWAIVMLVISLISFSIKKYQVLSNNCLKLLKISQILNFGY